MGKPEHVVRFMFYVAEQVRLTLSQMGYRKLNEVIGRVNLLSVKSQVKYPKDSKFDFSVLLKEVDPARNKAHFCRTPRNDRFERLPLLDEQITEDAKLALENGSNFRKDYTITNRERSVGARLSGEIAKTLWRKWFARW